MSGFEVVGVILGAYPLLITAVEVYNETRSGKGAQRLVRNLKTEEAIFNNFVHHLLAPPVISEAELTRLTKSAGPDVDLWKDAALQSKLEVRLGHENACIVVDILHEINELLRVLRDELTVSDQGMVRICSGQDSCLLLLQLMLLRIEYFTPVSFKFAVCKALPAAFRCPRFSQQAEGVQ